MPIESVSSARPSALSASHRARRRAKRRAAAPSHFALPGSPSGRAASGSATPRPGAPAPAIPRAGAALAGFAADVHLQADIQRRQSGGRCSDSRWAIFRRSTVCTQAKLAAIGRVLLLWIGPMKCHSRGDQVARAPRRDLFERFLQIVFAEGALARSHGFEHSFRREGLRYGQQLDARSWPARGPAAAAIVASTACKLAAIVDIIIFYRKYSGGRTANCKPRAGLTVQDYKWTSPNCSLSRQEQGVGPAPVRRPAADDPRAWRRAAHQPAADGAQGRARHGLRHHERRAAQALRGNPRMRLLVRGARPGALPRQRLQAEARRRRRAAHHSVQDPVAGRTERAEDLRRPAAAARAAWCW